MINLEDYYEEIPVANNYMSQGDFESAIEIYSSILDKTNPDEETVPYLYLYYSNALIKNCNQYFINELQNIHSGFSLTERSNIEDDLENAWNLLEISKNAFTILKDEYNLAKAHFLLGEISLLNNDFRSSIFDYIECIEIYKRINCEEEEYYEVYMSLASAYELLGDYEQAIKYYEECLKVSDAEREDIQERINENKLRLEEMNNPQEEDTKMEEEHVEEDTGEVKDININKKRII